MVLRALYPLSKIFFLQILWIAFIFVRYSKPDLETYLLPKRFEGQFSVIFNQRNGLTPVKNKREASLPNSSRWYFVGAVSSNR
jgi:hypothetical protein